jgi:hypothetical protein
MIAGGWAAMAAAFWFNSVWDARPPTQLWDAVLVVATGVGTVMALVAIDVVHVWRGGAARLGRERLVGLALGAGAWLWGGLLDAALAQLAFLGRSGVRDVLGMMSAVSATPALVALIVVGRRSRVAAWLSPVVISGLYLLAVCLWKIYFGMPFAFPLQSGPVR